MRELREIFTRKFCYVFDHFWRVSLESGPIGKVLRYNKQNYRKLQILTHKILRIVGEYITFFVKIVCKRY